MLFVSVPFFVRHLLPSVGCAAVALVLTACASLPPTQEMADARAELRAAEDAGAKNIGVEQFRDASHNLILAERKLDLRDYGTARNYAILARSEAAQARKVSESLRDAKEAIAHARGIGKSPSDAEAAYQAAVESARRGDIALSLTLAQNAVRLAGDGPGR
jgi:hypothetical protein